MEGPAALKEAVQRMEASYSGTASGPISRVCVDDGVVSFNVARPGGGMNRISVCFADVASYPACPVFLASEDSSNDDPLAEQLQALSERFQDQSPLDRVVVEVRRRCCCSCKGLQSGLWMQGRLAYDVAAATRQSKHRSVQLHPLRCCMCGRCSC